MYPAETEARLAELRAISQTRDLTQEESKEVLTLIRQDRVSAAYASKASKEKKATPDGGAVLKKLQDLLKG